MKGWPGGTVDQRLLYTDASLFPGRTVGCLRLSQRSMSRGPEEGHNFNLRFTNKYFIFF